MTSRILVLHGVKLLLVTLAALALLVFDVLTQIMQSLALQLQAILEQLLEQLKSQATKTCSMTTNPRR